MSDKCEIIYILKNEAFPELIKIGKTKRQDITERMKELYSSGVPLPFDCLWAGEVEDCTEIECILHNAFLDSRINPKREFFKLDPERIIPLLKKISIREITNQLDDVINQNISREEKDALGSYKKRRPNLNFDEMGIPKNSELVFTRDKNVKTIVISAQRVLYNNRECSLSGLTKELLQIPYYVGPTPYWTYNNINLYEIYTKTYPYAEEYDSIC